MESTSHPQPVTKIEAKGDGKDSHDNDSIFACNICLEPVKNRDPVVTQCGHLYCWPCLYRWLNSHHTTCPVCKAGVSQDNVIPIFIRGSSEDPRTKISQQEQIPNRPQGRRPEPQLIGTPPNAINNGQFGGSSFTPGFGFFPSLFGLQFQSYAPEQVGESSEEELAQEAFLSRILLCLGILVIFCLLFF